jgi:curved DNA-binding protein CbpA
MNIDDNELFEKMTGSDKKEKSEKIENEKLKVEKFGFDYYKILSVDRDTNINDIKKKYRKLLAKYHPDKYKNLPEKERHMTEKQFQLVQIAGKVLTDEDAKKMYDLEQKTIKSKSFVNQKSSFEDFIKLQESGISEEGKKRAQLDFESEMQKLNKARNFDPSKMDEKLDKNALSREIDNIRAQRDADLIELEHRNLFEGRSFNPSEFNKLFEKNKKKQEKSEKKKKEKGEIVRFGEEFTAFNDNGVENFISVDSDYSELFGSDNFRENTVFSNIKKEDNFDLSDLSDVDSDYDDSYKNHNTDRDIGKIEDKFKQMMREREMFDTTLKDVKSAGYKDVMHDQFGISKQFGKIIGKDITQNHKTKKLDSDMIKIYNRMITHDSDSDSDSDN